MDPVGVISLVYDVSKDLYTYYVAFKECDTDIKELRTQLLSLQRTSITVTNALKREGLRNEDKSQVEEAVSQCEEATTELKSVLDKIKLDGPQPQKTLEKLKALGRKAVYPFKKSTIAGLAEEVETCQDALHVAISILQLNIGSTTIEQLREIDARIEAGTTKLGTAFEDLRLSNNVAKDEIIEHLLQQRKLLTDGTQEKKALAIVDSLKYPEMFDRRHAIPEADETSLGWLFTQESSKYPELTTLMTFLNQENGLFWIQGKPASGKSTFVKYLLNRSHGRDKLWSWAGGREVMYASHFCWIAGSPMQKSQQGLLRTLLYQILSSDLALVPIACPFQWTTGASHGSWYEKELWDCLYAAVAASDKRVCFFIDGLDEIEPEKDHVALSKAIIRLSLHDNIKVVASSRPWPAFERTLKHDGRAMTMECINHRSIVNHIRNELDANATCETFARVDWDCIATYDSSVCMETYNHNDAHDLVWTITERADGVFLWVALIMDALCRHLILGCPISVLRSYLDTLPSKLEDYFRTLIFKRIHESVLSDTAMVLWISLIRAATFSHFALLCQYKESGVSWLMDPEFCLAIPCSACTWVELEDIVQRTSKYIIGCCRDILDCPRVPSRTSKDAYFYGSPMFTHRTIFDFLHTPEMQTLMSRHVPKHFLDDSFRDQLLIAGCKVAVIDDKTDSKLGWLFNCRLREPIRERRGCKYPPLAAIAEEVALHQFQHAAKLVASSNSAIEWNNFDNCTTLSIELSAYGLFSFTDTVIRLAPYILTDPFRFSDTWFEQGLSSGHGRKNNTRMLRKVLQAGLDINCPLEGWGEFVRGDTTWRILVKQLERNILVNSKSETELNAKSSTERYQVAADDSRIAGRGNLLPDPSIQEAVIMMIEFGADVTSKDVETLRRHMPKTMADGSDWSEFLIRYSRPDKRQELREDRKNRIRDWPEKFGGTNSHRKLMGLDPLLYASY